MTRNILFLACVLALIAWARVEDTREAQCFNLTKRSGAYSRYTLLDGCQVLNPDGIWRSAIPIDVRT